MIAARLAHGHDENLFSGTKLRWRRVTGGKIDQDVRAIRIECGGFSKFAVGFRPLALRRESARWPGKPASHSAIPRLAISNSASACW